MRPAVVLACMVALASAQLPEPVISNNGGLEFRLRDDGYREMMIHYNINKALNGVAAGDHMGDVRAKTGDAFVHTDPSVQLQPGDTVHYWMLVFKTTGEGLKITDRTWTYTGPTTPKPTTTRRPLTSAPHPTPSESSLHVIASSTTPPSGSGSGSVIGTGSGTGSGSGIGTGSGTGSGHAAGSHSGSSGPSPGNHMNGGGGNGDSSYLGSGHNGGMPFSNGGGRQGGGSGHTSGSGGGSCNCDYGPGHGDGFVDDRTCQAFPCLIFEDNFDFLNHRVWEHEITAGGGGNWEFQYYTNNRTNSYTRDGILYIKPTLTSDQYGQEFLEHGKLDLWGSSAADVCTSNMDWGCKREGQPGQVINPIQSARLRSSRGFNFRYGKVEVEAKLPTGDWLWPAIWMLPRLNVYGKWPASGEIDIMESRGNLHYRDPHGKSLGADSTGSTLHFGADFYSNQWPKAHKEVQLSAGTYADDFHKYGVEWDNTSITFTVDGAETLRVAPGPGGFWELGGLDQIPGHENPWRGASRMAPFDQEFYLLLNVAVGGVGFFKDENRNSPYPKPWQDGAGHESDRFWAARNLWYPTWHANQNNGEDAALKVNYVRVWKTKPDPRP